MKKILLTLIAVCFALPAMAQNTPKYWTHTEIKNGETHIAHMVHSIPVAISGNELRDTSAAMRMICTPKDKPVIGVKWSTLPELNTVTVQVDVDGRTFRRAHTWNTDGTFMYRKVNDSADLVTAMKKGKQVTLKFTHEGKTWSAIYPLSGFTNVSRTFDKYCKS